LVATLDQVFRKECGRVLATLIGLLGDFDVAEELIRRRSPSPPTGGHRAASPTIRALG
jgi:hypothetical protein